jgi:hypothetical protein
MEMHFSKDDIDKYVASYIMTDDMREAKEQAALLLEDSNKIHDEIPRILQSVSLPQSTVHVSDGLWHDSGLKDWAHSATQSLGGGKYLWNIVSSPTSDVSILEKRQHAIIHMPDVSHHVSKAKDVEKDVLWLLTLPALKEAWPMNTLFLDIPVAKLLNHIPPFLSFYQLYRTTLLPWSSVAFPLSTLLGPWIYMRFTLKIKLPFKKYCSFLYSALKMGMKPSDSMMSNGYKYISLFLYVFFYIYGIVQGFQTSMMMKKMQNKLSERIAGIHQFVANAKAILDKVPAHILTAFDTTCDTSVNKRMHIPEGMSGLYGLMTSVTDQDNLRMLCRVVWTADVCMTGRKLLSLKTMGVPNFCQPKYTTEQTEFYHMGHICLPHDQIRNPASLQKNLIITGPNAAGKTTYVRSLLTNIILSQSLGIAYALSAKVVPVHALGTFMRISDELGSASLFEAEVNRCTQLIQKAELMASEGKRATFFLDEPMHSTPPVEGSATSRAVIQYIAKLPGIRVLVTTHYHDLTNMIPELFHNISMDAKLVASGNNAKLVASGNSEYMFPYTIQRGPSYKCIALELLEKNMLPSEIVSEAIRIKNEMIG